MYVLKHDFYHMDPNPTVHLFITSVSEYTHTALKLHFARKNSHNAPLLRKHQEKNNHNQCVPILWFIDNILWITLYVKIDTIQSCFMLISPAFTIYQYANGRLGSAIMLWLSSGNNGEMLWKWESIKYRHCHVGPGISSCQAFNI